MRTLRALVISLVCVSAVAANRFPRKRCSADVSCPAGKHAISGWGNSVNATCVDCPFDTFKPLEGTGCCTSCGAGTTNRTSGATSCLCPPGTFKLSTGDCRPCSRTSYSTTWNAAACDACPAGSQSARWGTSCTCPPGTQALPGTAGPAGVVGCTNCTANTANPWPTNATDACRACPASSISLDGMICVCPAGSFASFRKAKASAASVSPADKGWWWDVAFNFTCTPCPNNTVQPYDALALMCKPCKLERSQSISNVQHTQCVCDTGFYATKRDGVFGKRWRIAACVQCANTTTTPGPGLYQSCNVTLP